MCIGTFLYTYVQNKIETETQTYNSGFTYKDKTKEEITGAIETFPSYRYANNQYVVSIVKSQDVPIGQSNNTEVTQTETKILVYTQPYQKYAYLDKISFSGSLQDIRMQDPIWYLYYKKLGVQYVVWYPNITQREQISPHTREEKVSQYLFIFKIYIRNKTIELFSSKTSALILGMLIGEKDELSKEEKDLFNQANLSHILVVSGYNISLVISFIFLLLKPFHTYIRISIAVASIFLFVLLVGHDASVVRSALMGVLVIIARISHRQASAIHTLFLVAMCMILFQPLSLFDAGFHLSFLATYALLILPRIKKIPEYLATTLWVFIFICAYILYLSGSISFIGIITNLLVLVCIPVFMFVSFASLFLSVFHIFIGLDIFLLESMSRYIYFVVYLTQFFPRFEYQISPPVTVGIYSLILSYVGFFQNRYTTLEFMHKHYQKFVPHKSN